MINGDQSPIVNDSNDCDCRRGEITGYNDDSNGTHNHGYIVSYGNDHAGDNDFTVDAKDDD